MFSASGRHYAGNQLASDAKSDLTHYPWEQEVIEKSDEDQPAQHDKCPAHVMANHFALIAYKLGGRDTHTGSLRRDRLTYFSAY
jgi:hypothetical protein